MGKHKEGGSDEKGKIKPEAIKTKKQFEALIRAGKVGHISNSKLAEIGLRTGYIKLGDFMAKGGMANKMKKKGMAKGGMKKKGMAMGGMKKKGMAMGGMKKKGYAMGGMRAKYKVGGMAKGKKYGSVDNLKKK